MDTFIQTLEQAGFKSTTEKPQGKQYWLRPRFARKGQPDQRLSGHVIELEFTEAHFNESGILEAIEPR